MSHELLVPVKNYACLVAAINNGADAVYLGGKKFGARAYADNFTLDEILDATKLCHLYGVKIYVTVNTLIYESEFMDAVNYVKELHKIGVDAVIMQDVGLISVVHKMLPNLEIHASTQMHNYSEKCIPFLESLGIKRIVFARELSLDYINNIDTKLEKEVFIHGSLCISYSGQCLFSSLILNRSGNRGECAQMCRLPYKIYEEDKLINTDGDYILSPKDLCSVQNMKKLLDSNVLCFKIEGRMKSPEYVGIVTKIYRTLITQYENNQELKINVDDMNLLKSIFNRCYTDGFLFNDNDILNTKNSNHQGIHLGKVTSVTDKYIGITLDYPLYQFESIRFSKSNVGFSVNYMHNDKYMLINKGIPHETIYIKNTFDVKNNEEVLLTMPNYKEDENVNKRIVINIFIEAFIDNNFKVIVTDNENKVELLGSTVEKSISSPLTKERIKEIFSKCGNTPFKVSNIEIKSDENIFVPVGKLNELRRNALDKLKDLRENKKKEYIECDYLDEINKQEITNSLNVLVRTEEQLKACLDKGIKNIIVKDKKLMSDNLIFRVPRNNLDHNYSYNNLLVGDYASLEEFPNNRGDYYLNITNHYTLNYLSKYARMLCISVESTIENTSDMMKYGNGSVNTEVLIYGNVELMLIKNCLLKSLINQDKLCNVCLGKKNYYLKDRNNKLYRIDTELDSHSTIILNYEKTNLIDKINYFKNLGITNFRVEFLEESYEEVIDILERVKNYG